MSLFAAQKHKKGCLSGNGRKVLIVPRQQHRFMAYHDEEGHRYYVDFVGEQVGFTQVCKIQSLTNVSSFCLIFCLGCSVWWWVHGSRGHVLVAAFAVLRASDGSFGKGPLPFKTDQGGQTKMDCPPAPGPRCGS